MNKPGHVEGKHFTQYVDEVKRLKRERRLDELERLLLSLVGAVEQEAVAQGWGLSPWHYSELANLYHKQMRFDAEVEIIERYVNWPVRARVSPNVDPTMLLQLERAKQARGDPSLLLEAAEEAATFVSQTFTAWRDSSAQSRLPDDQSEQDAKYGLR